MTKEAFATMLSDLLSGEESDWDFPQVQDLCSFREAGVMTTDVGLKVTMDSGDVFYLTIQKKGA